jgi:PHD/YefM family antitoxin component YafN of YafNO toxin-antitoxin module
MEDVEAQEFEARFEEFSENAIIEPIIITKGDNASLVVMSYEEFHSLTDQADTDIEDATEIDGMDFQCRFEEFSEKALIEPIVITDEGEANLAVISYDEFNNLRAKAGIQEPIHAKDFTEDDIRYFKQSMDIS